MKPLIFLITMLLLFSCTSKKVKNDLEKDKLKGKVSIIKESRYSGIEIFGETQKNGLTGKNVRKYDVNGKLTQETYYFHSITYKFDEMGNLTEKRSQSDDAFLWADAPVIIYKYDNKGKMIEENQYHLDGSLARNWFYKYDSKGNKVAKSSDENFNTPSEYKYGGVYMSGTTYSYEYDKRGNLILETTEWVRDTFQYDNNNSMILHEHYSLGSLVYRETYNYDFNGNKLEYKKYKSDGTVESIETFKYDDKGNLIEENIRGYKNTYKYNDKGLLVEKYGYDKDGKLGSHINYIYDKFDDTGNWIKRRETGYTVSTLNSNGEYEPIISTTIVEREIKYY